MPIHTHHITKGNGDIVALFEINHFLGRSQRITQQAISIFLKEGDYIAVTFGDVVALFEKDRNSLLRDAKTTPLYTAQPD